MINEKASSNLLEKLKRDEEVQASKPLIEQDINVILESLDKNKTDVKPVSKIIRKKTNEEEGDLIQKLIGSGTVELLPSGKLFSKKSDTGINVQEFLAIISRWNKRFDGHEAFFKSIVHILPPHLIKNYEIKKMLPIQPRKNKRWLKNSPY